MSEKQPVLRRLKRLFPLILMGIVGFFAWQFWPLASAESQENKTQDKAQVPAAAAQPVVVADAKAQPMPVEIGAIAHVQTISSVAIRSRIDGVIAKVPVRDGQEVKAGDILFELDDRDAQAQLAKAQGTVLKDQAQLKYAQQQVPRFSPLAQKEFLSRDQLEQAQSNAAALEGTLKADQAAVASLQVQLSYTVIRAQIDGKIGTIAFKEGNSIKANGDPPLATLNQLRPIYVSFSVPQRDLARIQKAMAAGPVKAIASIPGDEGEPQQGSVAYIENAIDASTSTLSVKAAFPNPENRLWSGQFVNIKVTLRVEDEAIVVPSEAVQAGQQGSYVFVVKPDMTAEARPVTLDRTVGDLAVIVDGLKNGEKVVTTGQLRLRNGVKVQITTNGSDKGSKQGSAS